MVRVTLTPEAITSFRRLPPEVRGSFDHVLMDLERTERLRIPGAWTVHRLEGSRAVWTLKVGRYRGIFRWDGNEVRFIRFGPRGQVYVSLPK
jgi:mRNA-degrading endonuclease RelE of RelBE toxin-antitoxin system